MTRPPNRYNQKEADRMRGPVSSRGLIQLPKAHGPLVMGTGYLKDVDDSDAI